MMPSWTDGFSLLCDNWGFPQNLWHNDRMGNQGVYGYSLHNSSTWVFGCFGGSELGGLVLIHVFLFCNELSVGTVLWFWIVIWLCRYGNFPELLEYYQHFAKNLRIRRLLFLFLYYGLQGITADLIKFTNGLCLNHHLLADMLAIQNELPSSKKHWLFFYGCSDGELAPVT